MKLTRLNHAVLFVRDLDRSIGFYTSVLGMDLVVREPPFGAGFLRIPGGGNHHDLGVFAVGTRAAPQARGQIGLYHLAWQVDTIEDLATARLDLMAAGALTGESSHGATKSVYGADPDGNQFEIMWMLPRDSWGVYEDRAIVEPLDLPHEIERWAGVSTGRESQLRTEEPAISRNPPEA